MYNTVMYKKALTHFKKADPIIYIAGKNIELTLSIHPDPFLRLTRTIVGQQLSVKAASTIFGRFEQLFKKGINPKDLLKFKDDDIRACGISYQKIRYLKDLSQKVIDKEILLETLGTANEETVIKTLTEVKGIGVWSAEMFLMFSLGRPDVFSIGDLGLQNAIKKLYGFESVSKEQLLEISEKWKPYRTYACMVLWRSLDNEPK